MYPRDPVLLAMEFILNILSITLLWIKATLPPPWKLAFVPAVRFLVYICKMKEGQITSITFSSPSAFPLYDLSFFFGGGGGGGRRLLRTIRKMIQINWLLFRFTQENLSLTFLFPRLHLRKTKSHISPGAQEAWQTLDMPSVSKPHIYTSSTLAGILKHYTIWQHAVSVFLPQSEDRRAKNQTQGDKNGGAHHNHEAIVDLIYDIYSQFSLKMAWKLSTSIHWHLPMTWHKLGTRK